MKNSVNRPFHRTCRPFTDGNYSEGGRSEYIKHPKYAEDPKHYIRAFQLIVKDLQELFDYIEPTDTNANCYSFRIHELLTRTCIEVEANCKAILVENSNEDGYKPDTHTTMKDYKLINPTHRLSSYKVELIQWIGSKGKYRTPYSAWKTDQGLLWYQTYNKAKHNRAKEFKEATFDKMIDAICGLLVILAAQFHTENLSPIHRLALAGSNTGIAAEYFRITFPNDFPENECYNFAWNQLENEENPFQKHEYKKI